MHIKHNLIFFLLYLTYTVIFACFSNKDSTRLKPLLPLDYNMSNIYAGLAPDEIYTPDQYIFNVSCCFSP
jgi:hypothetical protein